MSAKDACVSIACRACCPPPNPQLVGLAGLAVPLTPQLVGLEGGLGICISNKFLRNAPDGGPMATLYEYLS